MASSAVIANFSKLLRGDSGSPEVFTEVAEVYDIALGAPTSPDIDVTSLGSTAREKRGGLPDFGTATVSMNFLQGNAQQEAMEDEAGLNISRNYRILHPNGVNGYQAVLILKACGVTGYQVDGKLIRVATFAVSGKPTRIP
jgi:hypothetical protein